MLRVKEKEMFCVTVVTVGVYFVLTLGFNLFSTRKVFAQDVFVYPEKGQSQEQMEKDKYECYTWAKGQTGFDPMEVPTATAPPPQQQAQQGGVARGAARGATVGVVAGAIGDDAGKGAAIGAASGALIGGMRRRDQQRSQQQAEQQWAQDQSAQYQQRRSSYDRAYGACLEGRGYSVK
jgi:hypothetical protein